MSEELDIMLETFDPIPSHLMIIVKRLINGDLHAENSEGEMVIIERETGTVRTFLDGDEDWVRGRITNFGEAWEIIGFHLGMTNGQTLERSRNEPTN